MTKKFVAFLDILGFKELVKNNSQEDLIRIYRQFLFTNSFHLSRGHIKDNPTSKYDIFKLDERINVIVISDSILIYSNDETIESFKAIIDAISKLLKNGIENGLPLRGALTVGELHNETQFDSIAKNLLIGKTIVDAFELEKNQQWSGCIIDKKILLNDNIKTFINAYLMPNNRILKYNVSFKKKDSEYFLERFVINWIEDRNISKKYIEHSFKKHKKSIENDSVKDKIDNTWKFVEFVVSSNKYLNQHSIES